MEIKRAGSQASVKGPADWFTGTVRIVPVAEPGRTAGNAVRSARTDRSRKCGRATSSFSRPAKNTGTARRRPPP